MNRRVVMFAGCLQAFAAGCYDEPAPALYCAVSDQASGVPINPLLGAHGVACFDDASACAAHAKTDAAQCSATPPRWHCYSMLGGSPTDPLKGLTFCYPSLALCSAASAPLPGWEDEHHLSPCKPVDVVYCQAYQPLFCANNEALCNRAAEMAAHVLVGSGDKPSGKCVARRSIH